MTNDNHQEGRESEIKRFVSKELLVEAVRLTFENQQEVKEWSGGKTWSRPPMRAVTGITLAVNFNVPFGHYIFRDEEGAFHYLSAEVFEKTYEPAPPEQAKQQEGEGKQDEREARKEILAFLISNSCQPNKGCAYGFTHDDLVRISATIAASHPASEGKPVDEGVEALREVVNKVWDWSCDYDGSEDGRRATMNYMESNYTITRKANTGN